jgi:tripartite-type tricarboxylate transporter receptor subunit TctC
MQRRALLKAAGSAALAPLPAAWADESWPHKQPISWICPYAPGGNSDQRSRQIAKFLSDELKQTILVENRAGAGGNIGTEAIAHAKPDGYTIGMGNFGPMSVNPTLFKNLRFDPLKDLVPVCLIEKGPLVLMVAPGSPFHSVKDIIAAAKANPGKLTFASGGIGGSHQLSGELFKSIARIDITHVPYKGGSLATVDLMGGQVNMMFEQMYAAAPSIRAGKLRALAITSRVRSPLFPDVPTMIEAGVPDFEVQNWQGLVVPAKTPAAIVTALNAATNKALADPAIREQMLSQGNEIGGGTPEQFVALVKAESARWGKLVTSAGIKPE